MNRKDFIKLASCAGVAVGWGRAGFSAVPSRRTFGPDDKLHHACIGVGGMGFNDLRNFLAHKRVEVVALCDVDSTRLAKAAELAPKARLYADWREMLEKEGDAIDSVNVAVPDHQHAIIALAAMRRGKHVYCQKPLCHDVAECREVALEAERCHVVTQLGTQFAAGGGDRLGVGFLRAGTIGAVKKVYLTSNRTGAERYRLAGPRPAEGVPPPKTLAWNLWLGTAPVRPYAEKIYHPMIWRSWQDFGTGWSGDIGCHIFDAVWKGMNLGRTAPKTVRAQVQESWKNSSARRADTWPQSNHITWTFDGVPASDGKPFTMEWFDGEFYPPEDGQALARDAGLPKFPEEAAMVFAVPPAEGEVRLREDGEAAVQEPLPRLRGRLPRRVGERVAVPEDGADGGDDHPRHGRDPLSGGDVALEPRRVGLRRQPRRHGAPAPHLSYRMVRGSER